MPEICVTAERPARVRKSATGSSACDSTSEPAAKQSAQQDLQTTVAAHIVECAPDGAARHGEAVVEGRRKGGQRMDQLSSAVRWSPR